MIEQFYYMALVTVVFFATGLFCYGLYLWINR